MSIYNFRFSFFRRRLLIFLALFCFLFADFSALLLHPDIAHSFTVKEEKEYGEKMLSVIRQEFKLIDDLDIVQYIFNIGKEVVAAAGPQYFNYHFYVIDNKEFNAFAAPSGLIFVHTGLIGTMKTEGELVSVIAHEIGHIMSRHIADRIEKGKMISAGTLAMILAGILVGSSELSQALITGGMATGQHLSLQFSRENEEEADRIGFKLMQDLNRSPEDMVSMLNTMYQISKIRIGNIPQYLLTHPMPKQRMGYVQDLIHVYPRESYQAFDQFNFQRVKLRVAALTGDMSKLQAQYNRVLKSEEDPESRIFAQYGLSLLHFVNGEYERSIKGLHEVNAFFNYRPDLWVDIGRAYMSTGDLSQAYKYFEMARTKDPGNWYATYYLAIALQMKGEIDRAELLYRQVLGYIPDYPEIYLQLAKISGDRGDAGLSHFYLGIHYYYDVNYPTSRFHFQKAIEFLKSGERSAELEKIKEKIEKMKQNSN